MKTFTPFSPYNKLLKVCLVTWHCFRHGVYSEKQILQPVSLRQTHLLLIEQQHGHKQHTFCNIYLHPPRSEEFKFY